MLIKKETRPPHNHMQPQPCRRAGRAAETSVSAIRLSICGGRTAEDDEGPGVDASEFGGGDMASLMAGMGGGAAEEDFPLS